MGTLSNLGTENSNTESRGNRSHELDEAPHPVERKNTTWSSLTTAKRILSSGHFSKIVLSSIKGIHKCQICFNAFLSEKQNDNTRILKSVHVQTTGVIANADYFERWYSRGVKLLERKLSSIGFEGHLRQSLKQELNVLDFKWIKCNDHCKLIKESFKENLVAHYINNWIIHMNPILNGRKKIINGNIIESEASRQYYSGLKRVNGMNKYRNPLPPELLKPMKKPAVTTEN